MFSRGNNQQAVQAFANGIAKKVGAVVSTGNQLYYHGNLIAEWAKDGLHISNGNYTTYTRSGKEVTGSKTTKIYLNQLPNISIEQKACKWILNGKEWDGSFIHIKGTKRPQIDATAVANMFIDFTTYKRIDGWRGYSEPVYAIAGWNDTGSWSDSPCPTNTGINERDDLINELAKAGIKTKQVTTETSNVFCVHHYLIPRVKDVAKGRAIVAKYLEENNTNLMYLVENELPATA